jgi:gas vesicle protein
LLFAPQSGEQTRQQIEKKREDAMAHAQQLIDDARGKAEAIVADAQRKSERILDAARTTTQTSANEIGKLAETASPNWK